MKHARLIVIPLLGLLAAYDLAYLLVWSRQDGLARWADFLALWSFARFAATTPAQLLYDPAALGVFQHALLPGLTGLYPDPYPPSILLILSPLRGLAVPAAYAVFVLGTLGFYLAVCASGTLRRLALLLAPTTLLAAITGQSGFLAAGLLTAGLAQAHRRPWLAGVLLGLLTYKPQLGLLVPIALLAAGAWRAIGATCATFALLVMTSSALFGWSVWPRWVASIPLHGALFEANRPQLQHLMPTAYAALRDAGAGAVAAWIGQAAFCMIAIVGTWRAWRGGGSARAVSAVQLGSLLATPYAFAYDLPLLTAAVLAEAWRADRPFGALVLACAALAVFLPLRMVTGSVPIEPLLILVVFLAVVRRGRTAAASAMGSRGQ